MDLDNSGFDDIHYANGRFVVCNGDSTTGGVYYSDDGKTWYGTNLANKPKEFVLFGDGIWVCSGGYDKANKDSSGLYYSTDGITWTISNVTSFGTAGGIDFLFYEQGIWLAIRPGYTAYTSTDGKTWTARTFNDSYLGSVVYGKGRYVVMGLTDGITYYSDNGGVSWSSANSGNTALEFHGLNDYGNGVWAASSLTGNFGLYYSTNGSTWTQSNVTTGNYFRIRFFDGLWNAFELNSGTIMTSTDGKTWSANNTLTVNNVSECFIGNKIWFTNRGYYSYDGINWIKSDIGYQDSASTVDTFVMLAYDNIYYAELM